MRLAALQEVRLTEKSDAGSGITVYMGIGNRLFPSPDIFLVQAHSVTNTLCFRLVATIFGRPHMIISPSTVPLPMMIDDEYLLVDGEGQQPAGIVSYLGLFLASLRLYDIMKDVVAKCYYQKEPLSQGERGVSPWWRSHHLDDILTLDNTLNDFLASIPNHLRTQNNSTQGWTEHAAGMQWRHAKILQCRFAISSR